MTKFSAYTANGTFIQDVTVADIGTMGERAQYAVERVFGRGFYADRTLIGSSWRVRQGTDNTTVAYLDLIRN